jgi:hypothetical protein
MQVSGDDAKRFKVVKLDSFDDVPGTLVSADDQTGAVVMKDTTGETKSYSFGPRAIRIASNRR